MPRIIHLYNSAKEKVRELTVDDATGEVVINDKTGARIMSVESHGSRHADGTDPIVPFKQDFTVEKDTPTVVLRGTETGARTFSLAENAGVFRVRNETDAVDEIVVDPANNRIDVNRDVRHVGTGASLLAHGSRHNRGGTDAIDWSSISRYKKATGVSISAGASGSPNTGTVLTPDTGYYNLLFLKARITPSGLATGESLTISIIFVDENGTAYTVWSASGVTAAVDVGPQDIDWLAFGGTRVTEIRVSVESTLTAPTSSVSVDIIALQT